jgi:methylenetetrahydrofolate reductase (NADPH)
MEYRSLLEKRLEEGGFVLTADVAPPRGTDTEAFLHSVKMVEGRVDALNVTENQGARVRACSLAGCALILAHTRVEPVQQVVCRGRNRLALQSGLLGASSLGVVDYFIISGDPTSLGDHPEAAGFLDLDSVGLLRAAREMEERGVLISGAELAGKPSFFLGAAVDPAPARAVEELRRMREKVGAGARFFQTQPVFDLEGFAAWMEGARGALGEGPGRARLLAGVLIMHNERMARSLGRNMPEINVEGGLLARMERSADPGAEGVAIAAEAVAALREMPGVSGVHLMAAGREDLVPRVLDRL